MSWISGQKSNLKKSTQNPKSINQLKKSPQKKVLGVVSDRFGFSFKMLPIVELTKFERTILGKFLTSKMKFPKIPFGKATLNYFEENS